MATLYFKVSSDYDEVIRLRQECEKLEAQLKKMDVNKSPAAAKALETQLASARQQMMGLVTEAAKVGATMERDLKQKIYDTSQAVNDFTQKIIDQKKIVKDVQYDVKQLGEAYKIALKRNPIDASAKLSEYQSAKKALDEEKASLFNLTQQQAEARLSVKRLKDEYSILRNETDDTAEANENISLSFKKLLTIIGGAAALKNFATSIVSVRGEFQQLEIAFSTMLKSKDAANKLMAELVDIAAKTPFDLQGVAQSAKQMLAYGSSAENVGKELVMLGNVAAGVGAQLGDIAYLYGTLRTQGRAYAVDIRQFAGRGIPIYEELAKVLGVTKDEVSGLVKEGKVGFKEVEQAFKNMTSSSGIYYNLMQEQSKSLTGQISNLSDAWDSMLNKIGTETQGVASFGISALKSLIENYETVGKILAGLIITYGTYKAACIAVTAVQALQIAGIGALTVAERIHYSWLVLTEKAQRLLNATMLANPYVLLVTSVGALCVGMYNLYSSFDDVNRLSVKLQNEIDNLRDKTEQNNNTIREYLPIAKDVKESTEKREDAIKKLRKAYPDYFKSLSIETSKNYDVADAVAASNEEYRKRLVLMEKLARQRYEEAKANYEKNQPKNGNIPAVMGGTTGYSQTSMSTQDLAYVKQLKAAWDTAKDAVKEYSKINSRARTNRKIRRGSPSIDKNDKNTNLGNKQYDSIYENAQKILEIERKQAIERAKEAEELENQVEQARINAMADGSDKIIAQREYDNKKELEAIDRAKEEYIQKEIQRQKEIFDAEENLKAQRNPKYKKKSFNSSAVSVDTSSFDELKYYTEQKQMQDRLKAEKDAMNTYLMEYGTYQQRKLAIAEEYAEKIQKAQNEGERLTLIKERDKSMSDVNLSAIKQDIDWAGVFGDFGTMLRDEIEQSLESVRKYMKSDEFKNMDPEDQAKIVEAVNNLRGNVSGNLSDVNFKQIGELTNELQNAQRKMIVAYSAEIAAYDNLKKAQEDYQNAMENGTSEQKSSAKANLDAAQAVADNMSQSYKQAVGEFNATGNNLKDATDKAVDAINSVSSAISQIRSNSLSSAYEGTQQLAETLGKSLSGFSGILGKAGGVLSKFASSLGGATGEIISAALGLLDLLKDGLGSIFADLSDLMFNAVNGILDDLLSGGIITKPLQSVVDGVSNILNTITFGGLNSWLGGNDKDVMETVNRLTDSNKYLQESIDRLRERIGDESNTAGQTLDYYITAKDAEEQWRENQQEIIKNLASAWTNSGYGFLGLGGKGSFNGHAPDSNWSGWDTFNETLKNFGFDTIINSIGDFWNLTPEQMELLRDNNPKEWQKLFDSDGHKNPLEAVEEYIEHAGELEELTNVLNENLTKISFDSLYDNFIDTLMDMDASAEDFADNMSEYFMRAALSDKVGEMFKTRLNNWYNDFASAMEDGTLSDNEIEALRNSYNDIVKDAMAERDDLANAIGYTSSDNEQQSASNKGYATASQDSIDELSGRTTAMYESNLRIETAEQQQTVAITELKGNISALTAQAVGIYNIADETRTILANSYLELQQIRENTGEIVKPIKQMQADIAEVKRNTARL